MNPFMKQTEMRCMFVTTSFDYVLVNDEARINGAFDAVQKHANGSKRAQEPNQSIWSYDLMEQAIIRNTYECVFSRVQCCSTCIILPKCPLPCPHWVTTVCSWNTPRTHCESFYTKACVCHFPLMILCSSTTPRSDSYNCLTAGPPEMF